MAGLNFLTAEQTRSFPVGEMAGYDPGRSYPPQVSPDGTMMKLDRLFSSLTGVLTFALVRDTYHVIHLLEEPSAADKQAHAELSEG
jgi:hypothetical protein